MDTRKVLLLACSLVLVAGCATKLFYQRLDWFIAWRLHDYVTLDDAQNARFKRAFGDLWSWHRAHELPLYARELREIAGKLDGRMITAAQVGDSSARFQSHWEQLMSKAVDQMCDIVRTLDDRQARDILEGVDSDIADFARDYVAPPEDELRAKSEKRTRKWITRWTGPLNDTQEALLKQWGQKRRAIGKTWLEQRKQWRTQLEQALQQRAASPACDGFRPLFVDPMTPSSQALASDFDYNEQLWNKLIADVAFAADDKQRARARNELEEVAGQLEQLAAMGGP